MKTYWWISKIYDRHFRPKQLTKVPKKRVDAFAFHLYLNFPPKNWSHASQPYCASRLSGEMGQKSGKRNSRPDLAVFSKTWLFFQKISVQIYQPSSSSLFSWAKIYKNKSKPSVRQFAFFLFKTILDNYFYLSLIVSNCLLLLAFSRKAIHATTSIPFSIFLPSDYSCPDIGKMERKTCLHSQIFVPFFQKMDSLDAVIFNMAWQAVKVALYHIFIRPFPFYHTCFSV